MAEGWFDAEGGAILMPEGGGFRVRSVLRRIELEGSFVDGRGLATLRRVIRDGGVAALPPGPVMARLAGNTRMHGLSASLEAASGPVGVVVIWRSRVWGRSGREGLSVVARLLGMGQALVSQASALERLRLGLVSGGSDDREPGRADPARTLTEIESDAILGALERTGGRIYGPGGAAKILGLHPNTLRSRMARLGLGGARDHRG